MAVVLLYWLVRRHFGPIAGVIAALTLDGSFGAPSGDNSGPTSFAGNGTFPPPSFAGEGFANRGAVPTGGPGGAVDRTATTAEQDTTGAPPGAGGLSGAQSTAAQWVQQHCTTVATSTYASTTQTTRSGAQHLYDCKAATA